MARIKSNGRSKFSKLCYLLILTVLLSIVGTGNIFMAAQGTNPVLTVGTVTANPGDTIQIPITMTSSGEVTSVQFDLTYDTNLLTYKGKTAGSLTSEFSIGASTPKPNKVRVIVYSMENALISAGTGTVVNLQFQVAGGAAGKSCALSFSGVSLVAPSEDTIPTTAINGQLQVMGTGLTLTPDNTNNVMGQDITLNFSDDSNWRGAISGVTVDGTALSSGQYTVAPGAITIDKSVFATAKDYAIVVKAAGYSDAAVVQTVNNVPTIPVTGIALDKTTDTITVGETDQLTATVTPANAANQNVTWTSDAPAIATVDANGLVKALAEGTANVTATTVDGSYAATCLVTVKSAAPPVIGPEALNFSYFNPTGNPIAFKGATDSVVDANGNIYVSDFYNNRIVKFDANGNFIASYGTQGSGVGQFFKPSGLAIDSSNNIYVADTYNNRIVKFNDQDNNGSIDAGEWQSWGATGSGALQFKLPMGVYVKNGLIYAADSYNHRLAVFDPSNADATWRTIGAQGSGNAQFKAPYDIAVDSQGDIWVSDTLNNRVQKLDKDGSYIEQYAASTPYGLSIDGSGAVFVAERQTGLIKCLTNSKSFGGKGTSAGLFTNPVGVNADSQNRLWVVDVTTGKVQCSNI